MVRAAGILLLAGLAGCHGFFGARTTDEDEEINTFAEARQRAAIYYDGKDFTRAAAQYRKALDIREDHFATRLAYAYSLMATGVPRNLKRAEEELEDIGERDERVEEVKRVYGLAETYRRLAAGLLKRSRFLHGRGKLDGAATTEKASHDYARKSLRQFERVVSFDEAWEDEEIVATNRVSASLKPDAYVGMAHCEIILGNAQALDHYDRAVDYIQKYAKIAGTAREFWIKKREAVLPDDPMRVDRDPSQMADATFRKQIYKERIAGTLLKEVAVRRALLDTYLYLNRYTEAVEEATRILDLNPEENEVILQRGRAYGQLDRYREALKDLKEYRRRQGVRLTEAMVRLNQLIKNYERKLSAPS